MLKFYYLILIVTLSAWSCVSTSRYKKVVNQNLANEEIILNLKAQNNQLILDTTEIGAQYRNLKKAKEFLELTAYAEKQHLRNQLDQKEKEILRTKEKLTKKEDSLLLVASYFSSTDSASLLFIQKLKEIYRVLDSTDYTISTIEGNTILLVNDAIMFEQKSEKLSAIGLEVLKHIYSTIVSDSNYRFSVLCEPGLFVGTEVNKLETGMKMSSEITKTFTKNLKYNTSRILLTGWGPVSNFFPGQSRGVLFIFKRKLDQSKE